MVDEHVELDDADRARFDAVALDFITSQFRDRVGSIREAKTPTGSEETAAASGEYLEYLWRSR